MRKALRLTFACLMGASMLAACNPMDPTTAIAVMLNKQIEKPVKKQQVPNIQPAQP